MSRKMTPAPATLGAPAMLGGTAAQVAPAAGPTLTDILPLIDHGGHSRLAAKLARQGITTLDDVRRAGGVARFASESSAGLARLVDAHADLARISSDVTNNAALITVGFDSTRAIAAVPRSTFLTAAIPAVGPIVAARIHIAATAMYQALDQMIVGAHIDNANGVTTGLPATVDMAINPQDSQRCQCCACQAAPSPAAYLADLLAYVVHHLLDRQQPITLEFLVDTFHQPFGDLPIDCEAVDQTVRQVRICAEVLRSYLGANPPTPAAATALDSAVSAYTVAAYTALLASAGTTFEELRIVRRGDPATRSALAARLGLTIDPYGAARPDALDQLLLDPTVAPPAPQALGEGSLERLFGLADTTRNPLSDGPTLNDLTGQITRWNLTGVVWGRNTDPDGSIYVSLLHDGVNFFRVALYRDSALTTLVASGDQSISSGAIAGIINVAEENSSGLNGRFEISKPVDTAGIVLGAVPMLTAWQLRTLRAEWLAADYPTDAYADGTTSAPLAVLPAAVVFPAPLASLIRYEAGAAALIFQGVMSPEALATLTGLSPDPAYTAAIQRLYVDSQRPPVVDPDIIGPDDFRTPSPKANAVDPDQPYDVWLRRRSWVDTCLATLSAKTKMVNGVAVPDCGAMLAVMYVPVTDAAVTETPWAATTPISAFENLWQNLSEGVDVPATQLRLACDLGLSVGAFNRLIDIQHADAAATADPRNPAVADTAWRELRSILAQAMKTRFFAAWRAEELTLPLDFGSSTFFVSLREPLVGDWPPLTPVGQPLIDPALLAPSDLPEPTVGGRALKLWQNRSAETAAITAALRSTRESSGLQATLRLALGDPNPGDPLPVDLDTLAQQLIDPNPAVVAAATATVQSALFLTVTNFDRLMAIRAMNADPNPLAKPVAADWIDLYAILTTAQIGKWSYPVWLTQEASPSTGVSYWEARKAALPLWRSNLAERVTWHAALAQRSSAPIIDPDLIGPTDLVDPVAGIAAFDLWQARSTWVQSLLGAPAPANLTAVDAALLDALGVDGTVLAELAAESEAGGNVAPRLAQLGLSDESFADLIGMRSLVSSGAPVLPVEWEGFWSILAQVRKVRLFSTWRQQEGVAAVVLGPDLFTPSPAPPATPAPAIVLPAWRASPEARQAWDDGLGARVEQQSAVITGERNLVDAAEGATLTQLRDALVLATGAPGADLVAKADWFTSHLLIDAETGGCQKTTRVEQAIETLQTVMTSVRDGQIGGFDVEVTAAPAAVSLPGSERIEVFVRGSDTAMWHKSWDGAWGEWQSIGGGFTSAPAVAADDGGTLYLFGRGTDNALWYCTSESDGWSAWSSLGGVLASAPTAVSVGAGVIDVYVLGTDGGLWHRAGSTASWQPWQPAARTAPVPTGGIPSAPAIAMSTSGTLDVFVRGGDNAIWHAQSVGGVWSGWTSLGGFLTSDPAVVSAAPGTLDVFARGGDWGVWQLSWVQASGWSSWTSLGEFVLQGPGVSSWGGGRLDIFIGATGNVLWHRGWDGTWHPWDASDVLTIDAPNFDAEWTWMGSYATWRAAILVFMYPENLLQPPLRKYQTPAFQKLVADVQATPGLTPAQARAEACQYDSYFRDVCTLRVECSCRVWSRLDNGVGCTAVAVPRRGWLLDMFGRAANSNTAYWSSYDETDTSGYPQTFWDVVPGLSGQHLVSLFGSTPFWVAAGKRYVFLFFTAQEPDGLKLRFTRYDPEIRGQNGWEGEVRDLALPGWSAFTAQMSTQNGEGDPPRIAVTLSDGSMYERQLNRDGTDWSTVDWVRLNTWMPWTRSVDADVIGGLALTVVSRAPDQIDAFWIDWQDGSVHSSWSNVNANGGKLNPPFRIDSGFGGVQARTVSAVVRGPDHLDIFVVANGGTVYTNWWDAHADGGQWHTFQPISAPGFTTNESTVAAVARTPTHLDLFVVSPDGHVWSTWWDANPGDDHFHPWFPIGDPKYTTYQSAVAAVARGPGHLDVFMIDTTGRVRQNKWDASGTPWASIWESIAQSGFEVDPSSSPLCAVCRTANRVDLFVGGNDQSDGLAQTFWDWTDFNQDFGGWHSFVPVQATAVESFQGSISALGRLPTHLDVFVAGLRPGGSGGAAAVFSTWQDANADGAMWHPWFTISDDGGDITDVQLNAYIAAVSRIPSRIDLFVPISGGGGKPGGIYNTYWQGVDWAATAVQLPPFPPVPNVSNPLDIPDQLSSDALQIRRALIKGTFDSNAGVPLSTLIYLEEAYYFVPVYLAKALADQAQFTAALDWFRTVYDYSMPVELRNIYYGFELEKSLPIVGTRLPDWLLDPLNPHLIAATRHYAYARYTILSIARCFLAYADARFTFDSAESDAEARTLYMTAIALLVLPIFAQSAYPCEGLLVDITELPGSDPLWDGVVFKLKNLLLSLERQTVIAALVPALQRTLSGDAPWGQRVSAAREAIAAARRSLPPSPTVGDVLTHQDALRATAYPALLAVPALNQVATAAAAVAGATFEAATTSSRAAAEMVGPRPDQLIAPAPVGPSAIRRYNDRMPDWHLLVPSSPALPVPPPVIDVPAVSYWFCTPPNPMLDTLRSHAELNLYKLRNCMNIAGISRQVDPYAVPTDVASGLPTIGMGGQLLIPGAIILQPTPYRYATLIERAKNLVQLASQIETAMLGALEKRDAAAYDELQARQNLASAAATVQLQTLAVNQATDAVTLAELQQQRAGVETAHWQSLLGSDIGDLEQSAIDAMYVEAGLQVASAVLNAAAGVQSAINPVSDVISFGASSSSAFASSLSSLGASFGTIASISNARASVEAQQSDWQYQYALGVEDQRLSAQQIVIAQDGVRIAAQQRAIAQLDANHSAAVVEFLTNKFTNAALYEWMSTVLQGVYSYFLRQATAVGRLAENQMAFERQEVPPGFIKTDYWQPPSAGAPLPGSADAKGLTGAERLLQDIYQLDQYYQDTNKRKLQLTKTISLAQRYPVEFQRLRETGVMNFATTLSLFDRDFPGTYLCLIEQVRTSVVALIPPTQGIKATLSTTAATRVVIGPDVFQKTTVRRDPESVALTSPTNATGVFALDPQADLMLPFEGLGVEAQWQFAMPKSANPLDYSALADVIIAIDYTALQSPDYRAVVLRTIAGQTSAERPFSFRNDLADQWYDLHNPDQTAAPMTVEFETARTDFPPNLDDLRINGVLLYFSRPDSSRFEVPVSALRFTTAGGTSSVGGAATTVDGTISTRRGNASAWVPMIGLPPFGTWQLALPASDMVREWFANEVIDDMLFVITYSARTPA